ncbi:uncharacterized protein LOC116207047 [Punica granatum]|uniref:PLAC8 motif-containing protein n=2 Tax=Punica granatum TaxID=22663 RepID=A0A218W370_PUNGR|nr:uncharacterized protein LOC116207047 [Punica granatum]XP_031395767.1 uncharacterized protein LOC116207047 [Punica granatum]OWM67076.1 hypothetical protein CDL15_Pgr000528 [Punica granatum]PKI33977.1 hypothetical protein CRG98_045632 [Punica granatum]
MAKVRDEENPPSLQENAYRAGSKNTFQFSNTKKAPLSYGNCKTGRSIIDRIIDYKFEWKSLRISCKDWINNPLKLVLLLWIACVGISGAVLFLVMSGMLNRALPRKPQRDAWFEINNQILNALFTLMCLYQHPRRIHHLVLLLRWRAQDASELRKVYCKNGSQKPRERSHVAVVILLLHVNCFAQYALCSLNLVYDHLNRPIIGVIMGLSIAIAAPGIAAIYSILSPLGKEYDVGNNEERINKLRDKHGTIEYEPKWRGGLLDLRDDPGITFLSIFCGFCLFGWNMERLGLGNKYVHIANFTLFLVAPFWIFSLAAMHLENETVREFIRFSGIILSVFGLCYGGFWRIQMRERFNLPTDHPCCGKPGILDCAKWLFCCWCALAQEVRTSNFYDIIEDKFCRKQLGSHPKDAILEPPHPLTIELRGSLEHNL